MVFILNGMKKEKSVSSPGRPRAFDVDEALEKALDLFRRQGYEGTSLTDLTTAMGINRPSLYAAFGNKEELFRHALESYWAGACSTLEELINEPVARTAVEKMLGYGATAAEGDRRQSCLLVGGALTCSQESAAIKEELSVRRAAQEAILRERLERAKLEGELPPESDPADLARYFSTIMNGFSVQAVGGAKVEDLRKVVELAMKVWPA
jgi:AcrR family transcriptional regulator